MSGFFPVMMFGLPAACLAMYHTACPEKKKAVGGMLTSLQVVLGPIADGVAGEIRVAMGAPAPAAKPAAKAALTPGMTTARPTAADDDRAEALVGALGGFANIEAIGACSSRLRLVVRDNAIVDEAALAAVDSRGVVLGPDAERIGEAVRCLLPA